MTEPVRIFIGSGEVSLLERKTLIHSLRKNSSRELDIRVFNGTHNSIELDGQPPIPCDMSLRVKYRNVTEFSLYRYVIPQVCGYQGRAIYLDSDMLCLTEIGWLFDLPMGDNAILCRKDGGEWMPSAMLMDCSRCRSFDLEQIVDELDQQSYTYRDLSLLRPPFVACRPCSVGELDPAWNSFDRFDPQSTKIIHYTNLLTQPWRTAGHRHGELWFRHFREAVAAGIVTNSDINLSISRGSARPNIRLGNRPDRMVKKLVRKVKGKLWRQAA